MKSCVNSVKRAVNKLKTIVVSCYLCIRFPFLFPRNRFSGLHYTNWTIHDWLKILYDKSHTRSNQKTQFKAVVTNIPLAILCKILGWIYRHPLQWIHCIPSFTELDSMSAGWRKAFGIKMCKEIKKALLKDGGLKLLYSYRIMQIKEKYGTLRWYDGYSTKKVLDIINKYEQISAKTCICCGKSAIGRSTGWILPYCAECAGKNGYDISDENNFRKFNDSCIND